MQNKPSDKKTSSAPQTLCPSSNPDNWDNGIIFGVVLGTPEKPEVMYLPEPQPASEAMLALSGSVEPDEIFRIASPCIGKKCGHFDGSQCSLISKAVQILPAVVESLPACRIRSRCEWWHQEGKEACLRCPQVVTLNPNIPAKFKSLTVDGVRNKGESDV